MEGNLRFTIDWASLIVGSKFTVFALFSVCIWGQFSKYKPTGGLHLERRFNGGFFTLPVWGAYIGGAYFRNFTVYKKALPRTRENQVCAILHRQDIRKNVLPKFIIRFCMEVAMFVSIWGAQIWPPEINRNICFWVFRLMREFFAWGTHKD